MCIVLLYKKREKMPKKSLGTTSGPHWEPLVVPSGPQLEISEMEILILTLSGGHTNLMYDLHTP